MVSYNAASSGTSGNTSGPTYIENGINGIPTLRFTNAATTYRYLTVDYGAKNLSNEDITAFAVINYRGGGGWIFDRSCVNSSAAPVACASAFNTGDPLFGSQIDASRNLLFDRRDSARVEMGGSWNFDTGYDIAVGTKYVLTFERKYGSSFIAYVNGAATGTTNSDTIGVIPMDPVKIGRHADNNADTLDIDISEMILFSGSLKIADREIIENYLGKKYGIKVN